MLVRLLVATHPTRATIALLYVIKLTAPLSNKEDTSLKMKISMMYQLADLLSAFSIGLLIMCLIFIFASGWLSFVFLILSCICLAMGSLVKRYTPEYRAAIKQQKELDKKAKLMIKKLQNNFNILCIDPNNLDVIDPIVEALNEIQKQNIEPLIDSIILPLLELKPLDEKIRNAVFSCAKRSIYSSTLRYKLYSKNFYDTALKILDQNPDKTSLKQYALEVGRWHYSLQRANNQLTIYDEQAIQNDILFRSE